MICKAILKRSDGRTASEYLKSKVFEVKYFKVFSSPGVVFFNWKDGDMF